MISQAIKTIVSWLPASAPEVLYRHLLGRWPFRPVIKSILSHLIPDQVVINGITVALNANDPIVSGSLAFGAYEQFESVLFLEKIHPGDVVFDIGANVGYYTALAAKACGSSGRVFAIEPDPENFSFLVKTVDLNGAKNVRKLQYGLADMEGEGSLFLCSTNRGDHRIYDADGGRDCISVPLTTMDSIIDREKLSHVDVMKIDIQGA
ncbi:FkbM family methyltransferase, partial [Patescibacteria group bacterium]|nr:FkbM family methyltransferase [Patescibacteria group bacterium]